MQSYSRVCEYDLDEKAKTVRLVWQFDDEKRDTSKFMGSVQHLSNDDFFIGWGGNNLGANSAHGPALSEVRRDGSIALQMDMTYPYVSYRAFHYDWTPPNGVAYVLPHYPL